MKGRSSAGQRGREMEGQGEGMVIASNQAEAPAAVGRGRE